MLYVHLCEDGRTRLLTRVEPVDGVEVEYRTNLLEVYGSLGNVPPHLMMELLRALVYQTQALVDAEGMEVWIPLAPRVPWFQPRLLKFECGRPVRTFLAGSPGADG